MSIYSDPNPAAGKQPAKPNQRPYPALIAASAAAFAIRAYKKFFLCGGLHAINYYTPERSCTYDGKKYMAGNIAVYLARERSATLGHG